MDYKTLTKMVLMQHDKKVIKQMLEILAKMVPEGKKI
jgi:hypothetical protein